MTAKILDGKKVAQKVFDSLRKEISSRDPKPRLAIIRVGDNPASKIYTSLKKKRSEEIGIDTEIYSFQENINEKDLLSRIKEKEAISEGIIVQLPLPRNLDEKKILNAIDPQKVVDSFTAVKLGKLLQREEKLVPATPKGIIRLLEEYNLSLEGKRVVIVNRSVIVGKPLVALLLNRGATVTICHSQTKNVAEHTRNADVLISAVGKSKFITSEMVKEGAVVIDVGISKEEGRIVGDVDFEEVLNKASYITPVPGGVGPMTVAMLLENVMLAQSFYNKFKKVKK